MRAFLRKRLDGSFVAADEASADVARRLKAGEVHEADLKTRKNRSTAWNRRYWLMVHMCSTSCERVEIFPNMWMDIHCPQDLHVALKFLTGHTDKICNEQTGAIFEVPKSIDFDHLDWDEWAALWPRILDAVHQKVLPGIESPVVQDELARLAS